MLNTYGTQLILSILQNKKMEIIITMWITTYETSMRNMHHKLSENLGSIENEKSDK